MKDPYGILDDDDFVIMPDSAPIIMREDVCRICNKTSSTCNLLATNDENVEERTMTKLRIVGAGSELYQSDLYRSAIEPKKSSDQIFDEYIQYRKMYMNTHTSCVVSMNTCRLAAEYYSQIRNNAVYRSQNKKSVMVNCLYRACLEHEYSPPKSMLLDFMQLPPNGMSRGSKVVKAMVTDGISTINTMTDPTRAEINTAFCNIGLIDPKYETLRKATTELVQLAVSKNIGIGSVLKSKVIGALYVILKHSKEMIGLVPTLQVICDSNKIRKNTVEKFINATNSLDVHFTGIYIKYNLSLSLL
jgi:hypothetical protein